MEYLKLKKGPYLSVEQMNVIYNNFLYLKEKLTTEGFRVGTIRDNSVTYDIHPVEIINKFQAVESNIETISDAFGDLFDENYEPYVWQAMTSDRRLKVWRWFDFLDKAYEYANKYGKLYDINNEPIYDINGEYIFVLQGEGKR